MSVKTSLINVTPSLPGEYLRRPDNSEINYIDQRVALQDVVTAGDWQNKMRYADWKPAYPVTFQGLPAETIELLTSLAPSAVMTHQVGEKEFYDHRVWESDLITDWLDRLGLQVLPIASGNITFLMLK